MNRVYYFSGTGNSFYVSKCLSKALDASLLPITSLKTGDSIEADVLVFVFPVYESKPPKIVTQCMGHLKSLKATKVIAIATYGVALASTLRHFQKSILHLNTTLTHGYGIKLPHNAVGNLGFTEREIQESLSLADAQIETILDRITFYPNDSIKKTTIFEGGTLIKQFPHVLKLLGILLFKGSGALSFYVTNKCIQCRLCQKICPTKNIEWDKEADTPRFGNRCTSCFACLQWCPQQAIQFGDYSLDSIGMVAYHHPKVTAAEMIRAKDMDSNG